MKANTPDLMKFKRLQRRLDVSVPELVGHLELLWIATAKNAPEGDIGRFSNEDIAIACYWVGDPDSFVEALVECGWLDVSEEWRLLVHDWAQHAPTYIHGTLKRHGRKFRTDTAEPTKEVTKEPTKEPTKEVTKDATTKPSLSKPSQAYSSQVREEQAPKETPPHSFSDEFKKVWSMWKKHRIEKQKPLGAIEEDSQLMDLVRFGEAEAIEIVSFTIKRGAINLIDNGDHKNKPANGKHRYGKQPVDLDTFVIKD